MNREPSAHLPRSARPVALAVLAGALLAVAGHAQAQRSPYFLRVSQTISYDSNLFRVPDALGPESDLISTTGLTVGIDQPIGRQRLQASLGVNGTAYRDNSALNGFGYDLGLVLDWEAASRWSGNARLSASQRQAGFESYGGLAGASTGRNQERARTLDLLARYGGASVLALEAVANVTDIGYSSTGFASRERESKMLGGGVRWRPSGAWNFGLIARRTDGEYPRFSALAGADEYERTDIDLTADFQPTGASRLSARLTHTDEDHDLDESRDFSGLTGELRWNYQLTGKVATLVQLTRETGAGSSITETIPGGGGASSTAYLSDSQLTNRLRLQADWDATAKIRVSANYDHARENFDTRFLSDGGVISGNRKGNSRNLGLSATYSITRVWTLACGVARLSRDSGTLIGAVAYEYDANTGYCSATLALQ